VFLTTLKIWLWLLDFASCSPDGGTSVLQGCAACDSPSINIVPYAKPANLDDRSGGHGALNAAVSPAQSTAVVIGGTFGKQGWHNTEVTYSGVHRLTDHYRLRQVLSNFLSNGKPPHGPYR